jgi:hypothetical protein
MWETNTFAASFHARLNVALQTNLRVKIAVEQMPAVPVAAKARNRRIFAPTGRAGCFNLS